MYKKRTKMVTVTQSLRSCKLNTNIHGSFRGTDHIVLQQFGHRSSNIQPLIQFSQCFVWFGSVWVQGQSCIQITVMSMCLSIQKLKAEFPCYLKCTAFSGKHRWAATENTNQHKTAIVRDQNKICIENK